jgi:ribosomal protein S18 acetylase RimI-like enzyme
MSPEERPEILMPVIRAAVPDDAPAIARIDKETWLATYPNDPFGITYEDVEAKIKDWESPEAIALMKEKLSAEDPNTLRLVAEVNGEVVGHSRLYKMVQGPNKLQTIYVLPQYQGRGLGRKLAQQGLEWLGSDKDIALEVAQYNEQAIHFYESLGFTIAGEAHEPIAQMPSGKTFPEYRMLRKSGIS